MNRSELTLQGGPNQHGTQKPRRTPCTNLSPPRLELQEPAQRHMVSRAQRETMLALLKYPFYPLFILDNGMNSISKSLTVLTPA